MLTRLRRETAQALYSFLENTLYETIMTWKETAEPVLSRMPSVKRSTGHIPLKKKLLWTAGVLVVYFFLTNIPLFGAAEGGADVFGGFRSILAGEQGTLMQVGIGPIVTASIVLQLMTGANLLGLDTSDPRDQILYQGLQKLLVVVVTALTAIPLTFVGGFLVADQGLASSLGVSTTMLYMLIYLQVFFGGILILYMDEIVSKWGIGSGVGLFIIAGVSQRFIGGIFAWEGLGGTIGILPQWFYFLTGRQELASPFTSDGFMTIMFGEGQVLAIITTMLIFFIVVYAESVRVEIPLSHARVKSGRGSFPVKLIYASVLPMILVRAVQMNIQFMGSILNEQWAAMPSFLGEYGADGQPISGFFYYTNPVNSPQEWMWWAYAVGQEPWQIMMRVGIDLFIMVVGGAVFAIFWVETTDMGPKATAKQIQNTGMQIPGFRRNPKILEKVLARYIPQVTVIGGALVGFLAVMANLLGTIGTVDGIGLLLTISILYKLYEEIAQEQLMEMHPMMRRFFD